MTRLTVFSKSLLLGMLTTLLVIQVPLPTYAEELRTQSDPAVIPELQLMKEEETVSVASRYEQPISKAPLNVRVGPGFMTLGSTPRATLQALMGL
jgi:hypothetical protein